jgi:hypothetical protein
MQKYFLKWLNKEAKEDKHEIEKFHDKAREDLLYTLKWNTKDTIYAVTMLRHINKILPIIAKDVNWYEVLVKWYQMELVRLSSNNSHSTSQMHNLVEEIELKVVADLMSKLIELEDLKEEEK